MKSELPLVVEVSSVTKEDENSYVVQLGMGDQKVYPVRFMATAAEKLAALIRALHPTARPVQKAIRLTVERSWAGVTADGEVAVLVETKEIGRLELPLGSQGARILLEQIAEVQARLQPSSRPH